MTGLAIRQPADVPLVSVRTRDGNRLQQRELELLATFEPDDLLPIREPRARKGQINIPGLFWMSKMKDFVWYESRLEMVILKEIDFDPSTDAVVPQPCQLYLKTPEGVIRHTPDFLVWRRGRRRRLVNVKARRYLDRPKNQLAFGLCQAAAAHIGFDYSTESEPAPAFLRNLNWLAGYRRCPLRFREFSDPLIERAVKPVALAPLIKGIGPEALVRPVLFHLLWLQQLTIDMNRVLRNDSLVGVNVAQHVSP